MTAQLELPYPALPQIVDLEINSNGQLEAFRPLVLELPEAARALLFPPESRAELPFFFENWKKRIARALPVLADKRLEKEAWPAVLEPLRSVVAGFSDRKGAFPAAEKDHVLALLDFWVLPRSKARAAAMRLWHSAEKSLVEQLVFEAERVPFLTAERAEVARRIWSAAPLGAEARAVLFEKIEKAPTADQPQLFLGAVNWWPFEEIRPALFAAFRAHFLLPDASQFSLNRMAAVLKMEFEKPEIAPRNEFGAVFFEALFAEIDAEKQVALVELFRDSKSGGLLRRFVASGAARSPEVEIRAFQILSRSPGDAENEPFFLQHFEKMGWGEAFMRALIDVGGAATLDFLNQKLAEAAAAWPSEASRFFFFHRLEHVARANGFGQHSPFSHFFDRFLTGSGPFSLGPEVVKMAYFDGPPHLEFAAFESILLNPDAGCDGFLFEKTPTDEAIFESLLNQMVPEKSRSPRAADLLLRVAAGGPERWREKAEKALLSPVE